MSRENSQEDVELRSRSYSSASNNSLNNFWKSNNNNKKYGNLFAMDGFALMEKDEDDDYNLQKTVLKGMDVDGICQEIDDNQNKGYHLDKLFNPQGPYYKQTLRFEQDKRMKEKRRNRKKSMHPHRNFLDQIDKSICNNDPAECKNFGIASLFESPKDNVIRLSDKMSRPKRKTQT